MKFMLTKLHVTQTDLLHYLPILVWKRLALDQKYAFTRRSQGADPIEINVYPCIEL